MKKMSFNFVVSSVLFLSAQTFASENNNSVQEFPFELSLDTKVIEKIVSSDPKQLVKTIKSLGIDIVLASDPENTSGQKKNPHFSSLPRATKKLLNDAEFILNEDEGQVVNSSDPCCSLKHNTIIILDTALDYTLIHEFMHLQLKPQKPSQFPNLQSEFKSASRRLSFYQMKLMGNPENLLSPLWRRDMIAAQIPVAERLHDLIQAGLSQEGIIEKTLARLIPKTNPYYNKERQTKGLAYGESRINAAIDLYNNLHQSATWCRNTVEGLKQSLDSGDLELNPETGDHLTSEELAAFTAEMNGVIQKIEPVKEQILKLKAFYSAP